MSKWRFPQYTTMTFTAMLLLAGCVSQQKYDASQQKYDALDTEYQQLNQTMSKEVAANQMQITRLQNAIKVTVNSELLFPSGGWQMTVEAQQTIGKIVPILTPQAAKQDYSERLYRQRPDRPGAHARGHHQQPGAVPEAGRQRDAVHDLAGRQLQPGVRAGFRRERPHGLERHAGGPGEEPARGTDGGWFGQLNQSALAGRREQPSIRPHRSKRPHPELGMTRIWSRTLWRESCEDYQLAAVVRAGGRGPGTSGIRSCQSIFVRVHPNIPSQYSANIPVQNRLIHYR